MPFPSRLRFRFLPAALLLLLLLLAGGWLPAGCSSPSPTTPPMAAATQTAPPPPPALPFGGPVDSLNGIAGHTFGEPLSAFPNLRLVPPAPGELTQAYAYEGTAGWFGKHQAQVPTQLYYFLDGKFSRFMALGDGAVLRPQATYLFGPGQTEGPYQLFWEGSRARAAYSEKAQGFGRQGQLDVLSKPLEAALAAQQQARLKAENAQ